MNIILTTLSLSGGEKGLNFYYIGNKICSGIQQQEPGTKYIMSNCKIDKIVISGSSDTVNEKKEIEKSRLSEWKDKSGDMDVLNIFLSRIASFYYYGEKEEDFDTISDEARRYEKFVPIKNDKDIEVVFVPDIDQTGTYNIIALLNELQGDNDNTSNIYMDIQGGKRTQIYINNSILQLLGKKASTYNTNLKMVVATNYKPGAKLHEIVNETDKYKIVDLISGMNAFFSYGKAGILKEYITGLKVKNKKVDSLINAMQDIDNAISFSRISAERANDEESNVEIDLKTAVNNLKNVINDFDIDVFASEEKTSDASLYNIFKILKEGIQADLGDLLNGDEIDIIALTEWCMRKKNIITAAAVIENYFPSYFVKHGLLYYAKNEDELEKTKRVFELYKSTTVNQQWLFNDINHFFIKNYLFISNIRFYKKGNLEPFDEKYVNNVQNALNHPSSYPISIYSDYDGDTVYKTLALYMFISDNRNSLAHGNNKSRVNSATLEKCMKKLLLMVKTIDMGKCEFILADDELKGKDIADKNKLWTEEIQRELGKNKGYGMLDFYTKPLLDKSSNSKPKYEYIPDLFALSGLLGSIYQFRSIEKDDTAKQTDFFNKNVLFSKMMLDYYIYKKKIDETDCNYDVVKNNSNKSKSQIDFDDKKTIQQIKSSLKTYDDFVELSQHLVSEEIFREYIAEKKQEFQAEADSMNCNSSTIKIHDIFYYYKNCNETDNSIKNMILYCISEKCEKKDDYLKEIIDLYDNKKRQ